MSRALLHLATVSYLAEQQQRETLEAVSLGELINVMEREKGDRAYRSLEDKVTVFPWSNGLPSAEEIAATGEILKVSDGKGRNG